jgi:hypothetical protein
MAKKNLKAVLAAIQKKQADLDMMDDQLMGMPEMAPDAAPDMGASPEFDMLSEKREQLEDEILQMREGVELISQWETFKGGPWSDEIKNLLGEIDIEIADIAGGEVATPDAGLGDLGPAGAPAGIGAPPVDMAAPAPPADISPAAPEGLEAPPAPAESAPAPAEEAAPLEPPMASKGASETPVSKKNNYQSPDKKGVFARSDSQKEGSTMATPTPAKASAVKEKLADVKSKREAIKKEAQQRVAAAWTIAKTMLPSAPAEVQKSAAANLLQNSTKVLNAMLRQTAKNAHYSKAAESFAKSQGIDFTEFAKKADSFTSVHKKTMNDLLDAPSSLSAEKSAVEKELKGEPKNAGSKTADDRKDAGPQTETYNDGRGCGGGKHTEPKQMDAGSSSSQTEASGRPENTVNKSEGDGKVAAKAAAESKKACGADCKGCAECEKKASASKCAHGKDCEGCDKCAAEKLSAEKHAGHKPDCDCNFCEKKGDKKDAASKTADEPIPGGDVPPMEEAAPAEAPMGEEPPMDAPAELPPADEPLGEADNAAEVLSDEKKMVVEEKIEEAQEAIRALEQEILQEGEEELDLSQVFNEEEMDEKVSALANEGDEHTAGNGEEYFTPSAAENMEASLDEPQMASMEDFFSLRGSDSDPLAHLIAGEIKSAADVAGMDVVPTSTGELANKMESNEATGDTRDNENDHDGDLFAEAIEDQKEEDGGFKRVKQDATNELEAPKSAAKAAAAPASKKASAAAPAKEKKPVISKLKGVTASEAKPIDIASALFGQDEF